VSADAKRIERLKKKYGTKVIDNGMRLRPQDFLEEIEWRDKIDQHFTRAWLDFTYGGLFTRKALDERTRLLVSISQLTCLTEMEELERQIRSALAIGATPREVLEVILQTTVYTGYPRASRGARLCVKVLEELGRLDEITTTQLPLDGRISERSLDKERPSWPPAKSPEEKARREEILKKYGWSGVSTRFRTQSHQGFENIDRFDRWAPDYLKLWFDYIYGELYPRGIIDDRTRLLAMVANCLALNEVKQLENHMRGSLLFGATPRQVLEVILQSTTYVGMPFCMTASSMLERILKEDGRLGEMKP